MIHESLHDYAPGVCETCKGPTPMKGITRCRACGLKRERVVLEQTGPIPTTSVSEWRKRYRIGETK